MLDFPAALTAYCLAAGGVFLGLWLSYDRRDRSQFDGQRRRTSFHCIRCGELYSGTGGAELMRCTRCGHENMRLKF